FSQGGWNSAGAVKRATVKRRKRRAPMPTTCGYSGVHLPSQMRVDNARAKTLFEPRRNVHHSAKITIAACCALLWVTCGRAAGQPNEDWPQFLGPHRNGTSDETGLLDRWPTNGVP